MSRLKLFVIIMTAGVMFWIYCILHLSTFPTSNRHFLPDPALDTRRQLALMSVSYTDNGHKQTAAADQCLLTNRPVSEKTGAISLEKRLPKCLIIGFAKCGTYALRSFLALHPDIVCSNRELSFFTDYYNKGLGWYRSQMPVSLESQITIEKTPSYILSSEALSRIRKFNASIKLIIIVRDPLIRLQSSYAHSKVTVRGFNQTFRSWVKRGGAIGSLADYAAGIKNVFRLFDANQVLVVEEEELEQRPLALLSKVEMFLGLCHALTDDLIVFNRDKGFYCFNQSSWRYRELEQNLKLDHTTGCFSRSKGREHPQIDRQLLQHLVVKLKPYNEKLFALLGKRYNWTSPGSL